MICVSKKLFSFVLSLVFVLSLFTPATAAVDAESNQELSQETIDFIEKNGVYVDSDSVVAIEKLSEKVIEGQGLGVDNIKVEETYAVKVTSNDGNTITTNILLSQGIIKHNAITPSAGSTREFPPDSWDDRLTIRATAVYDIVTEDYLFDYYQPIGCYFTYKKGTANTVSFISTRYDCGGVAYSYPGFENLGQTVNHQITASASYPSPSTMYSKTKEYPKNRCISVTSGGPFIGNSITFDFTVDGKTDGYTVGF